VVTVMKFTALELPLDRAVDLNDHGEVLGYRTSVGDRLEPVVWLAGGSSIVVLGCSDPVPYYCHSHYPVAMNSNPTVVGRQYSLSGMTWEGFRWYVADTVVHPVPISFPGNIADINDAGQIVGGGPGPGATLISDGTKVLLFGSNGSNSMASAINNAGHVTGYVVPGADGIRHVFLYADGTTQDLGTMDGASSDAQDINRADEIVGFATFPAGSRAFRYSSSSFTDLGSLGGASSAAFGINDAGQIVGWSLLAGEVPQKGHAFLYVKDTMYDLNDLVETLPVRLSGASKINNRGQILAYGCVPPADDNCRYYLMTPVSPF
jgi:probable HAF family extracellular repeat protein